MYAALAQRASFVVAMDSGPMHIAAAAGAPTVGIFALQSDEPDRWAPLGARTAVVRATYPCPPDHRKETCPDFACVRALDVAGILRAVDAVRIATSETT
jgi:ADP-heptose:LPS heptosyltransferase